MPNTKRPRACDNTLIHIKDNLYKIPYRLKNGQCANKYLLKSICDMCGKEHFQYRSNRFRHKRNYCSIKCVGLSHHKPEGFKKSKHGGPNDPVLIKEINHPHARGGWILEHRLVIEKSLGRYLSPHERVHHINMIQTDNRIENLFLCDTQRSHVAVHASLNNCVAKLLAKGELKFNRGTGRYTL